MEQVTSQIIPFCGEWLLVITRTIRRHNVVGEGRRLNILQYADITPCLPDQWGPMNMLLGKDKYTPHTTKHAARKFDGQKRIYTMYIIHAGRESFVVQRWMDFYTSAMLLKQWLDRQKEAIQEETTSSLPSFIWTKIFFPISFSYKNKFLGYQDVLRYKEWKMKKKHQLLMIKALFCHQCL